MHEEMHMTRMHFMNTEAREIVPFLDTTFGQHGARRMHLRSRHRPSISLTKRGDQDAIRARCRCGKKAQHGDAHSTTISTNNHTAKAYMTFRLYAWQCEKWHATCLLRAPI